jgi:hypothetical protein
MAGIAPTKIVIKVAIVGGSGEDIGKGPAEYADYHTVPFYLSPWSLNPFAKAIRISLER